MKLRISNTPVVVALVAAGALAPLSVQADQGDAPGFVVSQDARFYEGQLIRADLVPAGIHTITYPQYVRQQHLAGLTPRSISQMRGATIKGTIGVFR